MSKEIMLLESVEGLGSEGDVVEVADGYARNYLLPQKLAAPVTNATRSYLEKRERERKEREKEELAAAEELTRKLDQLSCTIPVKTNEEDKLFGSVTTTSISKVLENQGIELERDQILLDDSIDELGVFEVPIQLHPEVVVSIKVWVVKE